MIASHTDTQDYRQLFLSAAPLLDVRAPIEFERGAFPSAINIPLMTDLERHEVGLCYKRSGREKAIALGHKLVSGDKRSQRIEQWLHHAKLHPDGYLYCFRGGLRSRTVQAWLRELGIEYPLVEGGYKAMRQFLIQSLGQSIELLNFVIIGGRTGSGKTLLLQKLPHYTDLEGLAKHRGSSFGALDIDQPSNIDFENAIAIDLMRHLYAQHDTVFLEDEGRMIGKACVPESLREQMTQTPIVVLETSLERRIDISLDAYVTDLLVRYQERFGERVGFDAFIQHHKNALQKIVKRFGGDNQRLTLNFFNKAVERHQKTGSLDGYRPYIEKLLSEYYDPMYDYQIKKKQQRVVFKGTDSDILEWSRNVMLAN